MLDGRIPSFDSDTGAFLGVLVDDPWGCDLYRPNAIVFGPDDRLHVTSFRANENDTDKIVNALTGDPRVREVVARAAGRLARTVAAVARPRGARDGRPGTASVRALELPAGHPSDDRGGLDPDGRGPV
ncbi:hypothetical protein [Sorangium sp. So ce124]|uniref:hypothetical protein n=1 Tax=Sorangium sp. So ce124 TaxID=3133280 RepID=UPI003F60E8B8